METTNTTKIPKYRKKPILVEAVKKEGYTSQVSGSITVVLDTSLNEALINEGFAREFIMARNGGTFIS